MIPFRTQNGMIIHLRPDTIIRTGWDQATARGMLPGESGVYDPGDGRTMHVVRCNEQLHER